jgi:hypothetical protein
MNSFKCLAHASAVLCFPCTELPLFVSHATIRHRGSRAIMDRCRLDANVPLSDLFSKPGDSTMRLILFLLVASVGLSNALAQGVGDSDFNMRCVERLEMPTYPPLASQARIPAVMNVVVSIGANGAVEHIDMVLGSEAGAPTKIQQSRIGLFAPVVEHSIRASLFAKDCSGKSVRLTFHFVLGEDLRPGVKQTVSFGFPNRFWIIVPPMIVQY